jgi:hypothetical protein
MATGMSNPSVRGSVGNLLAVLNGVGINVGSYQHLDLLLGTGPASDQTGAFRVLLDFPPVLDQKGLY